MKFCWEFNKAIRPVLATPDRFLGAVITIEKNIAWCYNACKEFYNNYAENSNLCIDKNLVQIVNKAKETNEINIRKGNGLL